MCFLICIRLLPTACNASLYIYSWTQLVRPLVFGSYHSRVEKTESVPSISTLVGSAEPADPHGGGPGQPEGGRPKLFQFRENCRRHGREKHLELKVLLKRRKQQKMLMLRSVRRRTTGSELSFFNVDLRTCRTLRVRNGRASSPKKTQTWAHTMPRRAAVRLPVNAWGPYSINPCGFKIRPTSYKPFYY